VIPGEGAYVVSGTQQTLLKGRLYELVVPLVGAGRSAEELCDRLGAETSPAEVFYVLHQLEAKGYLCEEGGALPDEEAGLWSSQQVDPASAARHLAETSVSIKTFGVEGAALAGLLQASHVRVDDAGALDVVLVDSYLRAELSEQNDEALRTSRPWLLAKPYG